MPSDEVVKAKAKVLGAWPNALCADNGTGNWFIYVLDNTGSETARLASWADSEDAAWIAAEQGLRYQPFSQYGTMCPPDPDLVDEVLKSEQVERILAGWKPGMSDEQVVRLVMGVQVYETPEGRTSINKHKHGNLSRGREFADNWRDAANGSVVQSALAEAAKEAEKRVREANHGTTMHAVQYPDGYAITLLPFEPENVGAKKIGYGATEPLAWLSAYANLRDAGVKSGSGEHMAEQRVKVVWPEAHTRPYSGRRGGNFAVWRAADYASAAEMLDMECGPLGTGDTDDDAWADAASRLPQPQQAPQEPLMPPAKAYIDGIQFPTEVAPLPASEVSDERGRLEPLYWSSKRLLQYFKSGYNPTEALLNAMENALLGYELHHQVPQYSPAVTGAMARFYAALHAKNSEGTGEPVPCPGCDAPVFVRKDGTIVSHRDAEGERCAANETVYALRSKPAIPAETNIQKESNGGRVSEDMRGTDLAVTDSGLVGFVDLIEKESVASPAEGGEGEKGHQQDFDAAMSALLARKQPPSTGSKYLLDVLCPYTIPEHYRADDVETFLKEFVDFDVNDFGRETAARRVACPFCGSAAGSACIQPSSGIERYAHDARRKNASTPQSPKEPAVAGDGHLADKLEHVLRTTATSASTPSVQADGEREQARRLGERIGFGAMMQYAQEDWRAFLIRSGYPAGGEFAIGPCVAMLVPCEHQVRDENGHCDVCCGSGHVTKWVAEQARASLHPAQEGQADVKQSTSFGSRTTQVMRGKLVTHAEARESANRLIHSHFRDGRPTARISVPVSADDDDVRILDYIAEQESKAAQPTPDGLPPMDVTEAGKAKA